ncbi:MAG: TIGR00159 family protein [Myxococcales bacterium]|nr:TIGR00159 family protein [Myxococcales bacterium]MCB9708156.1 TIGR00159 family protein [Myxococcales bacterium]
MTDVADVALVAIVLYWVLLLIRGTRAMQMGIGLAFVFVLHYLSRKFGMVTLYTMLDKLLTSIVLIIVVIFQNDIRRALVRFGRHPFFRGSSRSKETHVFEEVISATTALAQKRIGALIVFERDAMLDGFIDQGTLLDAAVTKELLYGIFIPSFENPMHDGAVIIREGRVWRAGAFLPLTGSPKLDQSLGTRHRAAIGVTEETDAVVIVVSEERGAISLCFNGNIVRKLDSSSLREALLGLFHRRRKKTARTEAAASPPSRPDAPADGGNVLTTGETTDKDGLL